MRRLGKMTAAEPVTGEGALGRYTKRLNYPLVFVISIVVAFLLPIIIPGMGVSVTFAFTILLTLFAWLTIKWGSLKAMKFRANLWEVVLGLAVIVVVYVYKFVLGLSGVRGAGNFGLFDMMFVFGAVALTFYGFRSAKFFALPLIYIAILIGGYYMEFNFPQVAALEVWQASLMGGMLKSLGVNVAVQGNIITLGNTLASFEIAGECTGVKGIMAFGTLSTMAVLDIKMKPKRLALIIGIGFLGTFLINLARLGVVFLAASFVSVDAAIQVHTYLGYILFISWVLVYWSIAFKYLIPRPLVSNIGQVAIPPMTGTR
jgi:exosortase/archaeosortase family protein